MSLDAEAQNKETGPNQSRTAPAPAVAVNPKEIYELLGFATMTGEDPLRMWTRLRETSTWLVGPLAPDSWPGQVFIADHEDIFAFRFLSIPAAWMKGHESGNRAAYCAKQLKNDWWRNWPSWWRVVGPKAWDDSYARLIWQMPDGGPEVTYEWARTAKNEVVCRITNSEASDLVLQGYIPWDNQAPRHAVLYSEGRAGGSCVGARGYPAPVMECAGCWR